jgi:hypothetical protein
MTARFNNLRIVRQEPTAGEAIGAWTATAILILLVLLSITLAAPYALAHDSWISRGEHKSPAGEWCCGDYDCGVMVSGSARAVAGGYDVDGTFRVTYEGKVTDIKVREFWPYAKVMPSPDGATWRCHRPDGSPRCKFIGPPSG